MTNSDSFHTPALKTPAERIRVAKVVTNFYSGGTERQVANLVKNMDHSKFAVEMVCLDKRGEHLPEYEKRNIPVSAYNIKSLYAPGTLLQILRFARYLRSRRIQVVHSYNFYATAFAVPAARLAGIPLIVASIRDRGAYLSAGQKQVQKRACNLADRILVNADSIRDWLVEQGCYSSRISIIKNGIDLSRYAGSHKESSIRAEFNIPEHAPLIVMVSRLNAQKGVSDLIEATALVKSAHPDVHVLIVGKTAAREQSLVDDWTQQAAALGIKDRICFAGYRSDTVRFFKQATVSVLPSYNEGLSNTLLESMASGAPVVTTRVGGSPELIEHELNGLLVAPRAPAELAQAITRILDDPALGSQFSEQSLKKVNEQFSIQRMVSDTQRLYEQGLAEKTGISPQRRCA